MSTVSPTASNASPPSSPASQSGGLSTASGRELADARTQGVRTDVDGLAGDLKAAVADRPEEATRLVGDALARVRVDDRDDVAEAFLKQHDDTALQALAATAAGRGALAAAAGALAQGEVDGDEAAQARRAGDVLGIDLGIRANTGWAAWSDAVHGALDVVGFVPGLGAVPDLVNAGLHALEGRGADAALSATAAIPLFGDGAKGAALAAKAGKQLLAEGGEAALQRLVREGQPFEAVVRGEKVLLEGISVQSVNYVKRNRDDAAALRRAFDGGVRKDFLQSLVDDPAQVAGLRQAGFDDAAIARIGSGRVPQGWQVHHKLPLDDGGTNDFANLVLIRNDPHHIAVTNTQRTLTGHLDPGQSARIDWPMIPGFVYPPKP